MPASPSRRIASLLARVREEPTQLLRSAHAALNDESRFRRENLTAEDWTAGEDAVRRKLRTNLVLRGEMPALARWKTRVIDVLAARSSSRVTHQDSSSQIVELVNATSVRSMAPSALFAFARATRAAGLFEASYGFTALAYDRLERIAETTPELRNRLRAIQVAIHRQQPQLALDRWSEVREAQTPPGPTNQLHRTLGRLMDVWTGAPLADVSPEDKRWREDVGGKRVLLMGPGPLEDSDTSLEHYDFIAHVLRGASLTQPPVHPVAGRELIYTAGFWRTQLEAFSSEELRARYDAYRYFVLKSPMPLVEKTLDNVRSAENPFRLVHLNGHPNMVPLISFDLLKAGDVELRIVGTNFYASKEPYAAGPLTGQSRYHMTNSLASHNPLENRALVANLIILGRATADETLRDVVALSDLEYLRVLDEHYGEPQR